MGQTFHPITNTLARVSIYGALFFIGGFFWFIYNFNRSPYATEVNIAREQPIPFSHKHHVDGLGIDCRFCHTSVENSSFAGIPPTETCLRCHSIVWKDSPYIKLLNDSMKNNTPIEWTRVHDLPDHVYFDHSIHVAKGIACTVCHGAVDQMPLMKRVNTLHMQWCLSCHRHPESNVRPKEEVFNVRWQKPDHYEAMQESLAKQYGLRHVTNCSACHR